ncbi:hypothetical protein LAZ67_18001644, partial [Cordylochernes scorpioides]
MLKAEYRNECLSHTQVFKWLKRFKEGPEPTEDDSRPGRSSTSTTNDNIEKISKLIREERRDPRSHPIKLVPKLLTPEKKESRKNIFCRYSNQHRQRSRLVTQEAIHALEEPKLAAAEKARMTKSKFKAMMMVFFDIRGIVYVHWALEGQT